MSDSGQFGCDAAARFFFTQEETAMSAIHYTIVNTPHGVLLVAATSRGVCLVRFGDEIAELEERLHSEFPFCSADTRRRPAQALE